MDNQIYSMTKGQSSPTTPSPWGDDEEHNLIEAAVETLHPLPLVLASGAFFIARGHSGNPKQLATSL